jgi:hypothetical protein
VSTSVGQGQEGGRRGRRSRRPDPASGPVAALAERLWRLKKQAGDPSYAEMASLGAAASKSSLAAAAQGRTLPSWGTTWEFVRVLAVDRLGMDPVETEREWRAYWQRARDAMTAAEDAQEWGESDLAEAQGPHSGHSVDPVPGTAAAASTAGPSVAMPGSPGVGEPGHAGQGPGGRGAGGPSAAGQGAGGLGPAGSASAGPGGQVPPGMAADPKSWPTGAWPGEDGSHGWGSHHGFGGDDGGPPTDPGASGPPPQPAAAPTSKRRLPYRILAAAAVTMIVVGGGVYLAWPSDENQAKQPPVHPSVIPIPKPKDDSTFIKDITYPDGTLVKAGSSFEKVWRLRNSGSVQWSNRQLIQIGSSPCHAPKAVPIPETAPGHMVDVRVRVRAANRPTKCKIFFKMADSAGRILMPTKRPIFLYVQVGHL